jgi:hypothetical protein
MSYQQNEGTPASSSLGVITPSDTVDLAHESNYLQVGGAGIVMVIPAGDRSASPTPVPVYALVAGGWHPVRVRRVMATGTTATLIVPWYS